MAFRDKIQETNKRFFNVKDWIQNLSPEQIQEINLANKLDYSVAILNLHGDLNVGMIIRTAVIYQAKDLFIFGRKRFDVRSCVGSDKYINIHYIPESFKDSNSETEEICPKKFKETMLENNLVPFFIEQNGKNIIDINWKVVDNSISEGKKICFVFGNEGRGISSDILQQRHFFSSEIISIPQTGILRSLNVSSAASILLWEYAKSKM